MKTKFTFKSIALIIPVLVFITFPPMNGFGMGSKEPAGIVSKASREKLVWPPPPYEPKIEFIKDISKHDDIGGPKGFFEKTWEAIAGKEEEDLIIKPFGIATDGKGRLFVTDTASSSVNILDLVNGKHTVIEDVKGNRFASPVGIDVDRAGNIYVSDSIEEQVYIFTEKGKYLKNLALPESYGKFQRPTGIAIDKTTGFIYIVDTLACRIHVFTAEGSYKFSFGERGNGDGQMNYPTFIAVSKNGELYVSDSMNFRIQVFDRNGKFILNFGKLGDSAGDIANPRGIAADSDGNIHVIDTLFEALQIFDRTGQLLLVFGKPFLKTREFALPAGIAIDGNDNIYVADTYNSRIRVFKYLKSGSQPAAKDSAQTKEK
ncbi:MAG: 6-bladed beta-propeller [Nitrospirota bacterium]